MSETKILNSPIIKIMVWKWVAILGVSYAARKFIEKKS